MAGYGGIGSLPQTRDLFTAPGSLLGYDPYFQDIQRFQQGGLGTTAPVSYASLQDPDPYGAERTAGQRDRSLFGYAPWDDPQSLALGTVGTVMGAPLGVPALISGGIGAYQTLGEADKMRAGALPPGTADPLGFWDSLAAIFSDYENAFTDKDMETISKYGLGGDLGVITGGYNIGEQKGPRVNTPLGIAQWQHAKDELERVQMQGWMTSLSNQIAANKEKKFQAQQIDPRKGAQVYTMDLPPVTPRPTVKVEVLPELYVSDDSATGGGGESYGFGSMDTSDYGLGY